VARYLRRLHRRGDPKKSWLTFLQNHRETIVALAGSVSCRPKPIRRVTTRFATHPCKGRPSDSRS
jgi:hypothetical protein